VGQKVNRVARILPWILFVLVVVLWAPAFIYDSNALSVSDRVWALSFLAFPVVGLFLAQRIPSNAVGWLFIIGSGLAGAGISSQEYAEVVGSPFFESFGEEAFPLGLFCLFAAILLFPDGRYPNKWWRGAHMALLLGVVIGGAVLPEDSSVIGLIVLLNFLLPVAALVFRAVTGDGIIRRQIAGPVLVTVVGVMALALVEFLVPSQENGWIGVAAFMMMTVGIPVSIAFSITRYRLYEIDRVVSRTVSYAVVVGLLGLVFSGVVTLLTSLLPAESDLAVAGSTLAVAALFNPLRRRVQAWVDRRFNRSRYDAQKVMDEFSGSLRDRVDPDEVVEGWVRAVSETMQPTTVGVWVREGS